MYCVQFGDFTLHFTVDVPTTRKTHELPLTALKQQPGAGTTSNSGCLKQQPGSGTTLNSGCLKQQPGAGTTANSGCLNQYSRGIQETTTE
jgi:hypothetical protein